MSYQQLSTRVEATQIRIEKAKRASAKLDDWRRRSLPSDVEIGRTLYQNWLQEVANKSSFRGTKIETGSGQSKRGVYEEFRYTIRVQTTLEQLTHFLYDFYKTGHLHKISSLLINPLGNSKDLDLTITVEALSLTDTEPSRRDKLTSEPGNRLLRRSFDEYSKIIVYRNIFVAYTPPKPPKGNPGERLPREDIKPDADRK